MDEITVGYLCGGLTEYDSCLWSVDERVPDPSRSGRDEYKYGRIGSHKVAITLCHDQAVKHKSLGSKIDEVEQMMSSFPSLKLLILISSQAAAVPVGEGQVRLGDVMIAQKFAIARQRRESELPRVLAQGYFPQCSRLLTTLPSSLDEDIKIPVEKTDRPFVFQKRWGEKCRRPIGDNVDKLGNQFGPRQRDGHMSYSVVHPNALVVLPGPMMDIEPREYITKKLGPAGVVCFDFDHGQSSRMLLDGEEQMLHPSLRTRENVDVVPVLGIMEYYNEDWPEGSGVDENLKLERQWGRYAAIAAAACARRMVIRLSPAASKAEE